MFVNSYLDDLAAAGRLRQTSSASAAARNTEGLQIVIQDEGRCCVQTGDAMYTVDLLRMQCDCGGYDTGNLCKHLDVAYLEAQKCVDIEKLRNDMAASIVAKKQYHIDSDFVTVCPTDVSAAFVYTGDCAFCTCPVNSYGQKCVCLFVVDQLQAASNMSCSTVGRDNQSSSKEVNAQVKLQAMLTELLEWSKSDNYLGNNDLFTSVKRAHTLAFSHFGVVSKKRKIHALHAYRKRIEQAKQEVYKKSKKRKFKH